ncbi:MAG TPA: SgcJ/EcaC family oxidoreductase [Candidatus Limnocylindria bacterium]|nr:SgcJ/EcaC family oxidoreductase [Candidatus Limnocylindria bacterium]
MFERFTEKARRVIFFARYEASQYGSPYIETEHLLLGLFREDKALAARLLHEHGSIEAIRQEIESQIKINDRISTSVEVPLTQECIRILNFAVEEADLLNHRNIGTEHLLLGMLREEKCNAARILHARGLDLATMKLELARRGITEVKSLHRPAPQEVKIGQVIDQMFEAWNAKDAKKFSSFFQEKGQLWDIHGKQSLGSTNIEKALSGILEGEGKAWRGNVRDVKYLRVDVAVVTIFGDVKGAPGKPPHLKSVMHLVMTQTGPGWSVSSAFIADILPT